MLLALAGDTHAAAVMKACAVDIEELGANVTKYLDTELGALKTDASVDPTPTAGFQRVVQRAILHVQSSGREEVTGANVLVALFSERESHAVFFLQQQDMTRLDAVSFIAHGIAKSGPSETRAVKGSGPSAKNDDAEEEKPAKGEKKAAARARSSSSPSTSTRRPRPARSTR